MFSEILSEKEERICLLYMIFTVNIRGAGKQKNKLKYVMIRAKIKEDMNCQ